MSIYTVESSALSAVAVAIRAKCGTGESLVFPSGFKTAIEGLKTGGASLTVKAPEGSSITVSKDDVSYTKTGGTAEFGGLDDGIWSVEICLDGQSKRESVNIATAYNMEMSYELVLLSGTDQCTAATGGWQANAASSLWNAGFQIPTATYSESGVYLTLPPAPGGTYAGSFATVSPIDLSGYKSLLWESDAKDSDYYMIAVCSSYTARGAYTPELSVKLSAGSLDISSLQGSYYIIIDSSMLAQFHVNNIKLV